MWQGCTLGTPIRTFEPSKSIQLRMDSNPRRDENVRELDLTVSKSCLGLQSGRPPAGLSW